MNCPNCKTDLVKKSTRTSFKWIAGLVVFIAGLCFVFIPPIGTVIGIALIYTGNRIQKGKVFFLCNQCGYSVDKR